MRHEIRTSWYLRRALIALLLLGAAAVALAYAGASERRAAPSWVAAIRALDDALARGDVAAALAAREWAYRLAVASPGWEGLAAVGAASIRLGEASGLRPAMQRPARRAYLLALGRAQQQGSLEGALDATLALLALDERDLARRGLGIAERLAAQSRDAGAIERARALREQLAASARPAGALHDPGPGGASAALIP
jgi:hypothetical protein